MNATSGGLSLPLGSEPLSRFGRLRRLKARACAALATAVLVAVPALVTVNVVNAPTAAAATTCSPSAGTSISSITQFDFLLADRTLVSGTTNTVGAVYRYSQADPDNLYDVLVTIESIVDGDGNTAGGQFTNPDQDRQTAPVPAAVTYMDTPVWDFRTGGGSGVQTSTMRLRYDFVATGTNTPVTLNVIATTVDNDGAGYADNEGTIATVQEFVKYDTLPDAWLKATSSLMNPQADGTVLGLPGTLPGITPEATASIGGVYLGTSSVTWTAGHIMTYVASNPGDASGERMSALSFRCEPAAQGVLSPDLKLTKTLDTAGTIFNGQTISYTLTPSNVGFADAAAGWSVTEVPPAGLTITSMSGTGYTCDVTNPIRKCTSATALPGDTVAAPITVTAQVTASPGTSLRNVAYVSPVATATVPELIPLGTPPTNATNTDSTATNNDAQAIFSVGTPSASIELVKSITGVADTNGDGWIGIGDTVSYKFVVTNTGNVTLAPVTITDTKLTLTGAACVPTLAAGASADCSTTGSYVIQQSDITAGGVVNSATASGTPPGGLGLGSATDVSDTGTAPSTPAAFTTVTTPATTETAYPAGVTQTFPNSSTNPTEDPTVLTLATPVASISLVKSITGVVDTTGDGWIGVGDTVSYKFVVTNTGNVALAPVTITDDTLGLTDAACVPTLAAGASADCSTTGSYVIQQGDVDAGGVVNTATTTGTPPPSSGLSAVSDVSDTGTAPSDPGAFTSVDTPEDSETAIPGGVTTSVGNDAGDPTEDPTVLTLATPVASISLVKSISGVVDTTGDGWIGVGDTVSYTFVVTNTGNVTLAPVTITDDVLLLTDAACVDSLAAGATAECSTTGSHVIQQGDVDAGGVVNTATTTGTPPPSLGLDPVTDVSDTGTAPSDPGAFTSVDTPEDSETAIPGGVTTSVGNDAGDPTEDPTVLTLATPVASIELVKSITGVADTNGDGWIGIGDTVSYKFVVTNTGNVTLAPVTITDTTLGLTEAACADTLAAGASVECSTTGSYVIQQSDITAGGVVNTATTAGTPPASTGLADVSDVSDTGTAPDGPGAFAGVDTPGTSETAYPTGLTTTIQNSTTDPTEDPTVLSLATPVASISLVKSISGVVDTTGDGWIGVGDTVSYTFVVTNTGNVTLAPVTITDDVLLLTDAACVDSLAAGATAECSTTGSYVIQQSDVDAGGVVNTATTTGTPPVSTGLSPVSDVSDTGTAPDGPGAFTGVDTPEDSETAIPAGVSTAVGNDAADPTEDPTVLTLATPVASITLTKRVTGVLDTNGSGAVDPGDTITYAFSVTNTGNVTLAPVTVSDDMLGLTDAACVPTLAAGASADCSTTGSYVITEDDLLAGGVVNTATATGTPPSWSLLTDVTDVSDTGTEPSAPGQVVTVDGNETAETAIPAGVTTAIGNDPAVPGDDPTVVTLPAPVARIVLVKSVSGVADSNGSGAVDAGDTVSYTFSVTNTGNVTLAPVTISDDLLGLTDAACVDSLASGATVSCSTTGSYVITEADLFAGGVVNTATASGVPPVASGLEPVSDVSDTGTEPTAPGVVAGVDGPEGVETPIPAGVSTSIVNDGADLGEDPTVVTLPAPVASIVLVKSVTGVVDTTGDGLIGVGDTVSYAFSVTNTGNVTLAPVTVSDDMLGLTDAACVPSLAPRETLPCSTTGSYVLLQADVDAGGVENTATATGVPPAASGLDPVTDVSDTGTTPQGDVVDEPGVTETGNPLAVNPNDPAVPGDDPTTALITPVARIVLVKSVSGVADSNGSGAVDAGDTVSYTFSVTNTGNVTLAPVTISDDLLGLTDAACVDSLASGATVSCSTTGSYVITEADLFAGGVVNTATASGVPPVASGLEPVSDVSDTGTEPTAPGVVAGVDGPEGVETPIPAGVSTSIVNDGADLGEDPTVVTLPAPVASIVLVKSVTGVVDTTGDGLIGVGDTVSYAFSVTNTGNVTLAPVTVSDDMLGLTDAACVPSLAPRETLPCSTTGSYVLLQADVDAGGVENTATATGVPPAASGLDPVTDVSDTGTTPQGDVVDEPGVTETGNPLAVNPNDPAVPGDDPTTALITPVARIVLVKSVSGVADSNGSGAVDAGDTVSYTFSVTNTGNVTLAPVTISDDLLGLTDAACVDSLASGATVSCSTTGSYVITEADLFAGGVVNTATASGVPPVASGLEPVSDVSDTGTEPTAPGVVAGVDGPEGVETPIPAGVSTSIVNDGADLGEDPTVVTLPAPVASIVLVKSVTGVVDTTGDGLIGVGDTVSYAFSVTNTGNVTLAPVTVSDDMLGLTDAACVPSLAPRETLPCSTTGSYVLLQADVDAGGVENTATATGVPPAASGLDPVTDVSDTGTTPQGDVVDEPGVTETGNPLAVNPNDPAVPGDDPTTALITPVARIVLVKSVSGVADSNGSGAVDAGDTVSYTFSVTNTGNVTLAPVTISDDLLGLTDAACVDSLASGATVSCSTTGSYVITEADLFAGGVVNTATASGVPPVASGLEPVSDVSDTGTEPTAPGVVAGVDGPEGVETPIPAGVSTSIVNDGADLGEDPTVVTLPAPVASIVLVKSVTGVVDTTGDGLIGVGDTVSYAFSVTNTGNVTLAPVTVSDDMLGLTDAACVPSLAPRETLPCSTTGSYVLLQADVDAGGVENTATATGVPPAASGLDPVTDVSDTGTTPQGDVVDEPGVTETGNPLAVNPNDPAVPGDDPTTALITPVARIVLVKSVSGVADSNGSGAVDAGDTVSYTFSVTNTGNVTLAPVTISDDLLGLTDAACVDSLASGATVSCSTTGSYVITEADLFAGGVVNTATASGVPPVASGLEPVSDVSDTGTEPTAPGVVAGVDGPEGVETPIPAGVSTSIVNDGADLGEDPTVVTLPAPVASIVLVKSVTGVVDTTGDGLIGVGDTVSYAFSVTNTGNVTLAPVTVSDDMLGLTDAACVPSLAPRETLPCSTTGSYVLLQADVDAGGVENTATATGVPPAASGLDPVTDVSDTGTTPQGDVVDEPGVTETGNPLAVNPNDPAVPGDDPTTALITPVARIVLVKSVSGVADSNGSGAVDAGDTVSYTFSVTNTGNVTLAPVTISDDLLGLTDAACVDSLASGATVSCSTTGSYVITEADLFAGGVVNTATASGVPPVASGLEPVSDVSDTGTEPTAPGVVAGVDGPEGVETPIPAGVSTSIVNDGADLGEDPTVVTLPAPVASIVLVKSVTGVVDTTGDGLIGVGDTVSYAFSVTNTGNVTLAPVTVSDDMLGLTDAACVPSLAPRETLPCSTTGSYVITLADSQAGGVLNTATATGVPPAAAELEPVTDTSDAGTAPSGPGTVSTVTTPESTETPNPTGVSTSVPNNSEDPTEDPTAITLATPVAKIVLWKSISTVADTTGDGWLGAGDTITYTFTVKNTGNVPLAPVTITDAMLGFTDAACVDTLAAGMTATCVTKASYVITAADVAAGGVANTAVTTGTPPAAYELPKVTDVSDTGTAPGGPGEYGEVTDPDSTETGIPAGVTTSVTNNGADPTDDPTVLTLKERTPMPNTGSDSVPLVLGGLGLMLAGLVLVLLARRRRKTA